MRTKSSIPSHKVIRDAVHGDILIHDKFVKIIDTPEFQRLRRIRQLSTAYFLFPTAEHTRFSHSLGTYHVMQLLIDHFKPIFNSIGQEIKQRDIDLALCAALLHDIGHGPFSHAFENALPNNDKQKKHEEWTVNIITEKESEIYKVLVKNFDESFPEDLADLIKKEKDIKKYRKDLNKDEIDLFFIMSSLISSQLDADRMDYLIRDAFFTGVSYGKYDISRLIDSLTVTVNKNKYLVCVHEKYLSTVEEYLLSRYQMHEGVYLHRFKCEMELIVKKILFRAYELYKARKLKYLPDSLKTVFDGKEMSIDEYISLDDSLMITLFVFWRNEDDEILKKLCSMFIERKKYISLNLLDNNDEDIKSFEEDLMEILKRHNYKTNLENEYFWIKEKYKNQTYKDGKDNIWILKEDGSICDLFEVSKIITKRLKDEITMCYISFDLLKLNKNIDGIDDAIMEINSLINSYSKKNHIEIEKKYSFEHKETYEKVIDTLTKLEEYDIENCIEGKMHEDYYFDTRDKLLFKNNKTLRFRKKDTDYFLTIKVPTKKFEKENVSVEEQSERFEYEIKVQDIDIVLNKEYILKYLPELENEIDDITNTLIIKNNRRKIKLNQNEIKFEIVLDDVEYIRDKTSANEYQVEIELKSDYIHRVNLKMLSDYLEKNIPELTPVIDSKYKRGLRLTKSISI